MIDRWWRAWLAGAVAVMCATSGLAEEAVGPWPRFRGPGGLGRSADRGLPVAWSASANIAWKTELPGPGTSSPVVVGDRIYLTCYSGYAVPGRPMGRLEDLRRRLVCLSRRDGAIVWNREVVPRAAEQPNIREGHGYASSTLAVDHERIYAHFGASGAMAFDLEGRPLWTADVGDGLNGWGSAASPVLVENLVIINASVESESLVALDAKTGRERWRTPGIKESWNTPILVDVDGRTELVVAVFGQILGIDPRTGERLWSCATDISWYMAPSMVADRGVIYAIGGRSGGALAVRAGGRGDVTKTHRVWTGRKGSNVSSPVYHEGKLYWMHDNLGIAYCADAATGAIVYEQRIAGLGQVYASALYGDGKVYYLSRNGRAVVLPARGEFELLASNDLGDRSTFNASPAVADGRLYVRSDRHLYCIGER